MPSALRVVSPPGGKWPADGQLLQIQYVWMVFQALATWVSWNHTEHQLVSCNVIPHWSMEVLRIDWIRNNLRVWVRCTWVYESLHREYPTKAMNTIRIAENFDGFCISQVSIYHLGLILQKDLSYIFILHSLFILFGYYLSSSILLGPSTSNFCTRFRWKKLQIHILKCAEMNTLHMKETDNSGAWLLG